MKRRNRNLLRSLIFGFGAAGTTTAGILYGVKAANDKKGTEALFALPRELSLTSKLTYSQYVPHLDDLKADLRTNNRRAASTAYIASVIGVNIPNEINGWKFLKIDPSNTYVSLSDPHIVLADLIYSRNGEVKVVKGIISPKVVSTEVRFSTVKYDVAGSRYDSFVEAQAAAMQIVEPKEIYKIDGIGQTFDLKEDALNHLAQKLIHTGTYSSTSVTGATSPHNISGITPINNPNGTFWRYGTKVYQNKADAAAEWLSEHQFKVRASQGHAEVSIFIDDNPYSFDLPDFALGNEPTLGDVLSKLSWKATQTLPNGKAPKNVLDPSIATFTIDGQEITITKAAGGAITSSDFTLLQNKNQEGHAEVAQSGSQATFTIDGQTVTLTRTDGREISLADFNTRVTTPGRPVQVPTTSKATFTIDGQEVVATRPDGLAINRDDISLTTTKEGETPIPTQASTADLVINGNNITVSRADGGSITKGDITLATTTQGVAHRSAVATQGTFTIGGQSYTFTRPDGQAVDKDRDIIITTTREAQTAQSGTPSTGSFDFEGRHLTIESTNGNPITQGDIQIETIQKPVIPAAGSSYPTFITFARPVDLKYLKMNPDNNNEKMKPFKTVTLDDGTETAGYAPEYFGAVLKNRFGKDIDAGSTTALAELYRFKSIKRVGTQVIVSFKELTQDKKDEGWEFINGREIVVDDPDNKIPNDWINDFTNWANGFPNSYDNYKLSFLLGRAGVSNAKWLTLFRVKSNSQTVIEHPNSDRHGLDKFFELSNGLFYYKGRYSDAADSGREKPPTQNPPAGTTFKRDWFPDVKESILDHATSVSDLLVHKAINGPERKPQIITIKPKVGSGLTFKEGSTVIASETNPMTFSLQMLDSEVTDVSTLITHFASTTGTIARGALNQVISVKSRKQETIQITGPASVEITPGNTDTIQNFVVTQNGVTEVEGVRQQISISVPSSMTSSLDSITFDAPATNVTDLSSIFTSFTYNAGHLSNIGVHQEVAVSASPGITVSPSSITFKDAKSTVTEALLMDSGSWTSKKGVEADEGAREVVEIIPAIGIITNVNSITFQNKADNIANKDDLVKEFKTVAGTSHMVGKKQSVTIQAADGVVVTPQEITFKTAADNIPVSTLNTGVTITQTKTGTGSVIAAGVKESNVDTYTLQYDGNDIVPKQDGISLITIERKHGGFGLMAPGTNLPGPKDPSTVNTKLIITKNATTNIHNTAADATGIYSINTLTSAAASSVTTAGSTGYVFSSSMLEVNQITMFWIDNDKAHAFKNYQDAEAYLISNYDSKIHSEHDPDQYWEKANHDKVYPNISAALLALVHPIVTIETVTVEGEERK